MRFDPCWLSAKSDGRHPPLEHPTGVLKRYANQAVSAIKGAYLELNRNVEVGMGNAENGMGKGEVGMRKGECGRRKMEGGIGEGGMGKVE